MAEYPSSVVCHGFVLPFDVAQLVMDALYNDSSPEDHCYRNQRTYHNWSLVCHAWRMYAQSLLFRIVEVSDPDSLRRFSAHLDSAPHLARFVKSLRVYSRYLFTPHNVFSLLPEEIKDKLPNLRALAVTRISKVDSWHPLSSLQLSQPELPYIPLSEDFHTRLAPLSHVTTFKLYFVSLPCFRALARIVRALHNLRELAIVEVHWQDWDLPAFMLRSATPDERDAFLPKIEDLTLSWLDPHGPEHILAAIGSSGARSLRHLYIDCPSLSPDGNEDPENRLLSLDLSHCTNLRDLWVSIPHPLSDSPGIADTFASLLASWAPASTHDGAGRTLTITPTFEQDFTRAQFADVLRALGPVAEAALLAHSSDGGGPEVDMDICVCVCVIDFRAEKHAWWADTVARECFPRMYARGRVRAAFWKRYWDDSVWSEDGPAAAAAVEGLPVNTNTNMNTNTNTNMDAAAVHPAADGPTAADASLDALVPDVAQGSQEDTDEDNDNPAETPALQPQPVARDSDGAHTPPGVEDRSSVLRPPPRGTRRTRSLKKVPGLVFARITKVARALTEERRRQSSWAEDAGSFVGFSACTSMWYAAVPSRD
ncbi:hypothetical protein V8D89_001341 [Ganoderma adspersum]